MGMRSIRANFHSRPSLTRWLGVPQVGLRARTAHNYRSGARERTSSTIRDVVLEDSAPMVPLALERQKGQTQLWVKQVRVGKERYIVSRNDAEAEKDRADRQAIIAALQTQLTKGDKALVGNSAYRRYLRRTNAGKAFEIDAGKLADEARFDGITVLRTNAKVTPLQAVLRYRDLTQIDIDQSWRLSSLRS